MAALVANGRIVGQISVPVLADVASSLASRLAQLLDRAGDLRPGLIAACAGPGRFTSLRATLAVAAGLSLAWGVPAYGVGIADAFMEQIDQPPPLWIAVGARANRIFLGRPTPMTGIDLNRLPASPPGLQLVGDAAGIVRDLLAERDQFATVLPIAAPSPIAFATVAVRMQIASCPTRLDPAYIDDPEAYPRAT